MIVIGGLVVLLVAVIVGFTGVLTNTGAAHPLPVTGSTGTLFLVGIVVGAAAMLGLCVLLAGARRTAGRGRDARLELKRSQRETAFLNQERDQRLEHQQAGAASGSPVTSEGATTPGKGFSRFGRWSHRRQPQGTAHVDGRRSAAIARSNSVSPQSRPVIIENEGVRNEYR